MMVRAFALGLSLVTGGCLATGDGSDAGLMFGSGGPPDDDDGALESGLPFPDPPAGSESGDGSTSIGADPETDGTTTGEPEDPQEGSTDAGSTDGGSTDGTTDGGTETGEPEAASTGEPSDCDQPPGVMSPAALPDAQVGVPYQVTFSGPDGVYLYEWFTLVGAPPGLSLTSDSQLDAEATLSGTPTSMGSHDFFVIANPSGDGCVNADALIVEYTLEVDP